MLLGPSPRLRFRPHAHTRMVSPCFMGISSLSHLPHSRHRLRQRRPHGEPYPSCGLGSPALRPHVQRALRYGDSGRGAQVFSAALQRIRAWISRVWHSLTKPPSGDSVVAAHCSKMPDEHVARIKRRVEQRRQPGQRTHAKNLFAARSTGDPVHTARLGVSCAAGGCIDALVSPRACRPLCRVIVERRQQCTDTRRLHTMRDHHRSVPLYTTMTG